MREEGQRILAGDFNSPKAETDSGEIFSWGVDRFDDIRDRWLNAELDILTRLDQVGMIDVFREIHGYGDIDVLDISNPTANDGSLEGKRFDHMLASESMKPTP